MDTTTQNLTRSGIFPKLIHSGAAEVLVIKSTKLKELSDALESRLYVIMLKIFMTIDP